MNIYEDYRNYIDECDELLAMLRTNGVAVFYAISDVIKVTEYIYNEYEKNETLDEDLEEIFDIGYGFLSNVLSDMKAYYEDAFNKDPILFNKYSELLLYSIYVEDYKSYLEVEDQASEQTIHDLDEILSTLDKIFSNKKEIEDGLIDEIDGKLTRLGIHKNEYKPAYVIFQLISEELNLE